MSPPSHEKLEKLDIFQIARTIPGYRQLYKLGKNRNYLNKSLEIGGVDTCKNGLIPFDLVDMETWVHFVRLSDSMQIS